MELAVLSHIACASQTGSPRAGTLSSRWTCQSGSLAGFAEGRGASAAGSHLCCSALKISEGFAASLRHESGAVPPEIMQGQICFLDLNAWH